MVFGRNDYALRSGGFGRTHPLPAIQFRGVEHIRRLSAMSPFQIRKRIGSEMEEEIVFHVVPGELGGAGFGLGVGNTAQEKQENKEDLLYDAHMVEFVYSDNM